MFEEKTTIVVGAGASCELNLPDGNGLKSQIVELLQHSDQNGFGFSKRAMQEAMKTHIGERSHSWPTIVQPWRDAARRIRTALPVALSIDNYLHSHRDDHDIVRLGKLAIAICILEAEQQSHLFGRGYRYALLAGENVTPTTSVESVELQTTWYPAFAQLLMSGVSRDNIRDAFKNLTFVIFNYDRLLEQYLWLALQAYFSISGQEAADVLRRVEFIHPYGSLGKLPWQTNHPERAVEIGGGNVQDYWVVGDRLRTFTEVVKDEVGQKIKGAMASAKTVLMLGFGFLQQNLDLLEPLPNEANASRIIYTAYGMSPPNQEAARQELERFTYRDNRNIYPDTGTCRALFDNHSLLLARETYDKPHWAV